MKILQKNLSNPAFRKRHSKSSNKSRGTKKNAEKTFKDDDSNGSQEIFLKQNCPKDALKKGHDGEQVLSPEVTVLVEDNLKKPKLEKRKQDGNEWKTMKKVDYQRLETVMEEGQLSNEETSSKHNFLDPGKSYSGSDTENTVADAAPVTYKKSWICSLMSLTEHMEAPKPEECPTKKPTKFERLQHQHCTPPVLQPEELIKYQPSNEKNNIIEVGEFRGKPTETLTRELGQNKRSVILSGMMEILPIFSNDKFVCSRDAISIEEYEDLELDKLDRNGTSSGKTLLEAKSIKDSRAIDMKPFISANCMKKEGSLDGRFMERVGDFKEVAERKPRFKVLTDRNVCQQTSSPFINSLLVLSPFSSERERIWNEITSKENVRERFLATNDFSSDIEGEGKCCLSLKVCFGVIMTTLCLLMIFLTIVWRSYRPPCFVDSVMEVLPFIHRRRSYVHRFLDKLIRFLSSFLGGLCLSDSSSNRISELPIFKI